MMAASIVIWGQCLSSADNPIPYSFPMQGPVETSAFKTYESMRGHVLMLLHHRMHGIQRRTLMADPIEQLWRVGEIMPLVGEPAALAAATALMPYLEERDASPTVERASFGAEIAAYVQELDHAKWVLRQVRKSVDYWDFFGSMSAAAKTAILAHQVPKIFAIGLYRAPLEKLEHQYKIWEHCAGGNRRLWEAVGVILKGAREKLQTSQPNPPARSPRQHRTCYKCKHVYHVSEFVLMTGEPSRKSSLCSNCYWDYERERLSNLRYWERQYRFVYQKWFGPEWRLYVDANQIIYYLYRKQPDCAYCGRPNPPFSFFERRQLRRRTTKFCRADPLLDENVYLTPKTTETDFLDYLEHGGVRASVNCMFVCGECKVKRRDAPLVQWVQQLTPERQAQIKNLYRLRFSRRLGEPLQIDPNFDARRAELREWEGSMWDRMAPPLPAPEFLRSIPAYKLDHPARLLQVLGKLEEYRWKAPVF